MNRFGDERRRGRYAGKLLALALLTALGVVALSSAAAAGPTEAPRNTEEPRISGVAEQGRTLSASRGTWTGTGSLTYTFAWVRCGPDGGRPDGGGCAFVSGANERTYRLRAADVGFRMRVRVTATNAEGAQTVASNPTAVVVGAPVNTQPPWPRGTMLVGQVVAAEHGTWTGKQPISFSYRWLRCNAAGGECAQISGGTSRTYRLIDTDVGHKIRFNLTARNSIGSRTVTSTESAVVGVPLPPGATRLPSGEISIPASSVPADARLVVSQVRFAPSPVRSARNPIAVQVRVTDTRGYVVRDAIVFVRTTPRVTSGGDRQATAADGWLTYQVVPNRNFPQPRNGFNLQFFVKAYRSGDPPLAGVAAYRLVQVRMAG